MSNCFPTNGFKWIDPKDFDSNKYSSNNSKGFVLEVSFDYPLAPYKIEIKKEMIFINNFYNIYNIF